MQIIEKLISEGVIPYDVGTQLKESFDAKVEGRVAEITEAFKADLKEKNEKATAAFMNLMKESFEKKAQEHKLMLESKLCDYMDLVVENFVQENKEALETKMNESRVEALLEGFQSMMIASGVELKHIQEELEADKSEQDELQESKTKEFDALAEEVIELRKEIDARKKADLFLKLTEGLSDLQKEKLQEQAEKIADDISLEEVLYPFSIEYNDILDENLKNNQNTLDLFEFLWENIVLEVPLKFTKVTNLSEFHGDGWKLVSEEENSHEHNPFSELLENFDKKE